MMNTCVNSVPTETIFEEVKDKWPNAIAIRSNEVYGNYLVASRHVDKGEILLKEYPLTVASYGQSDEIPYCLTCGKALEKSDRCGKCNWPICNTTCENDALHALGECPILAANHVEPSMTTRSEFAAIEIVRGLCLKSRDAVKWNRILSFEAHSEGRRSCPTANALTEFIIDFVLEKCKLVEFDREIVDKVIGVFAVNTFLAVKDTGRNLSLVFDKVTLLNHDCDPNTSRIIVERESTDDNEVLIKKLFILITAKREIERDEPITICYTNPDHSVTLRQKNLSSLFFFNCKCTRCAEELLHKVELNGDSP